MVYSATQTAAKVVGSGAARPSSTASQDPMKRGRLRRSMIPRLVHFASIRRDRSVVLPLIQWRIVGTDPGKATGTTESPLAVDRSKDRVEGDPAVKGEADPVVQATESTKDAQRPPTRPSASTFDSPALSARSGARSRMEPYKDWRLRALTMICDMFRRRVRALRGRSIRRRPPRAMSILASRSTNGSGPPMTGSEFRPRLEERGISIQPSLSFSSAQFMGGADTAGIDSGYLFNLNVTLDAEKLAGLKDGTAFINFRRQDGRVVRKTAPFKDLRRVFRKHQRSHGDLVRAEDAWRQAPGQAGKIDVSKRIRACGERG